MAVLLLNGLIGYWDLDELAAGDTRVDSHTGGFDLVAVGAGVNPDTGLLNGCTRGTQNVSNYLNTVAHDDAFRPTGTGMTFACRALIPAGTLVVNHPLLAHYANTDRGWIFWGQNSTDEFAMTASNNGTTSVTVTWGVNYVVDTWYFVVGFLDSANDRIGIQVDRGATVWTALTAPFHGATQPLTHQFFSGSSGVPGAARCDELGFWSRILNDDELDELYQGGSTPPAFSTFTDGLAGDDDGAAAYRYYHGRV